VPEKAKNSLIETRSWAGHIAWFFCWLGRKDENQFKNSLSEQEESMIKYQHLQIKSPLYWFLVPIIVLVLSSIIGIGVVRAQSDDDSEPKVQELSGIIEPQTISVYRLLNLKEGQNLYVRMENATGNLDPLIMLFPADTRPEDIIGKLTTRVAQILAEGGDPLETLPAIYDEISLTWNDDFRGSFNAAFEFPIPEDDSYLLAATSAAFTESFGTYRLQVGLNEPGVLAGVARPTGDNLAVLDPVVSRGGVSIQEVSGVISESEPHHTFTLEPLSAGETLYAYVEATSGDLKPGLILESFNGKPLRGTNLTGDKSSTSTQIKIENNVKNFKVRVGISTERDDPTTGSYRLIIGANAPEVLTGNAEPEGRSIIREPIEVRVGSTLVQITNIDQLNEKFNAVAELRMEWEDPQLAFNPEDCQCEFKTFTGDSLRKFADENEILIPQFTIFNQQGNRWIQNENAVIFSDGRALYQEHYTTDLQAPLFDFTKFPFDTQLLYIQVESLPDEEFFTYTDPEELSGIGDLLGEEEWYIVDSRTEITNEDGHSTHWLYFTVRRHLNFYIFRIILPIVLVIIVSWFTFFLRDFGRRVEVSSATLLTFVAFNFTVADNLPRIGYLTFMDALLIGAFVVSVIVVIYNVSLKRLEADGRTELAHRIDKPMIWLYPILFILGAVIAIALFLF
jgi:hypothetical protein